MTRLSNLLCLPALALGLGCLTSLAREFEGSRENSILLNGQWESAFGEGDEGAETAEGGTTSLKTTSLSIALKLGFKPIPLDKIGLYRDEYR